MATGGAGTGTGSSDAAIRAALQEYYEYQFNDELWDSAYDEGRYTIPVNKELADKLFNLLSPETVNKFYVIHDSEPLLGDRLFSPLQLAVSHDLKFAKKLITKLDADILVSQVIEATPTRPRKVLTPLGSLIYSYGDAVSYDDYSESPDDILEVIAIGLRKTGRFALARVVIRDTLKEIGLTREEKEEFIDKLRAKMRELSWKKRQHLVPVLMERYASPNRRTQRRRSSSGSSSSGRRRTSGRRRVSS